MPKAELGFIPGSGIDRALSLTFVSCLAASWIRPSSPSWSNYRYLVWRGSWKATSWSAFNSLLPPVYGWNNEGQRYGTAWHHHLRLHHSSVFLCTMCSHRDAYQKYFWVKLNLRARSHILVARMVLGSQVLEPSFAAFPSILNQKWSS